MIAHDTATMQQQSFCCLAKL